MSTGIHGEALALAALLALSAPAAGAPPPPQQEEVERLEEWPEIAREHRSSVKLEIERLRKARTEEMGTDAHAELLEIGAGVVPEILPLLAKERDEEARGRLERVLVELTRPEHSRLLAAEFDAGEPELRVFALRRASAFPDAGNREAAERALAAAREALAEEEAEPLEVYAAALACAGAGSLEGLAVLLESARDEWLSRGAEVRAALVGCRGPRANDAFREPLGSSDRELRVAALRVFASCGEGREATVLVRPHLDEVDHLVRLAAINALRGIVDGDPPLEDLSVFDAIEHANRWKERVR